ncbi:MAG: hypothetical protein PHO01_02785 [Desulfotomaculaceae bacterium]|nr:hypothetical protein [Desulfotomaculaceae bacterium]
MKEINHRIKRTDGSRRLLKRKQIHCPKCGCRIIDAARSTRTLIKALSGNDESPADYYMKCRSCRTEIGLQKLENTPRQFNMI